MTTLETWLLNRVIAQATLFYRKEGTLKKQETLRAELILGWTTTFQSCHRVRLWVLQDIRYPRRGSRQWDFFGPTRATALRAAYQAHVPGQSHDPA